MAAKIASAVACAKTAARALDAVRLWVDSLTKREQQEVRARLERLSEYKAVVIWSEEMNRK